MTVCEMSIKDSYVSDWGSWESVREIIQNGLDADDRGWGLSVTYENGVLKVHNFGADLQVQSLVLGVGDKVGDDSQRGKHCEGLALGILAGVRSGSKIEIRTKTEKWIPSIEYSDMWKTKVLVIRTRKMKEHSGVTVFIPIEEDLWLEYKRRFLKFSDLKKIATQRGCLLLDPNYSGMLYDKGIFVEKRKDLKYGYDFRYACLDRDRKFFSSFEFNFEAARILGLAVAANPSIVSDVTDVLLNDGPEARATYEMRLEYETKDLIANEFIKRNGDLAIPVQDIDSSRQAASLGFNGVVVPRAMMKCLENTSVNSLEIIQEESSHEVLLRYSWDDFTKEEWSVYKDFIVKYGLLVNTFYGKNDLCKELSISTSISKLKQVPLKIVIVDFSMDSTRGMWNPDTEEHLIARKEMTHVFRFLRVVLHELAHSSSGCSDVDLQQGYTEAEIFLALAYACSEVKNDH